MLSINYNEGYLNLPELCSDKYLHDTSHKFLYDDIMYTSEGDTVKLSYNEDVVSFRVVDEVGYSWSSREGLFNTEDESIAIVKVVCDSHTQYYKLAFIMKKIRESGQNIGLFKIEQFQEREIYYVPYEVERRDDVLKKLENARIERVLEDIRCDGSRLIF